LNEKIAISLATDPNATFPLLSKIIRFLRADVVNRLCRKKESRRSNGRDTSGNIS